MDRNWRWIDLRPATEKLTCGKLMIFLGHQFPVVQPLKCQLRINLHEACEQWSDYGSRSIVYLRQYRQFARSPEIDPRYFTKTMQSHCRACELGRLIAERQPQHRFGIQHGSALGQHHEQIAATDDFLHRTQSLNLRLDLCAVLRA
ncbi:MAG: hypothetical protein ACI8XO_003458 [Verrucomicrobiales bacterium]|jgi:hypothetical protein